MKADKNEENNGQTPESSEEPASPTEISAAALKAETPPADGTARDESAQKEPVQPTFVEQESQGFSQLEPETVE